MANFALIVFFIWHIGSVIVWLGSTSTFAFGISPSLKLMNGDGRVNFIRSFFPRFLKLFGGSSISAVIAGTLLFAYLESTNSPYLPTGWRFVFISIGAVMGIVAATLSLGVILPMGYRLLRVVSPDPTNPLEVRPDRTSFVKEEDILNVIYSSISSVVAMLTIAFIMMVMAAYF